MQVGALRALIEAGITPDLVVGTSAGSMNAAFVAFDPTPHGIAKLASIWGGLDDDDLFPGARFRTSWARVLMKGNRVFDNTGLRRVIESRLGTPAFEDARIPFAVVATELETGAEQVFSSGPIIEPLLASAAMPGIFPPVEIDGKLYMDGGVCNQVPIAPALDMGARRIFVLNASAHNHRPRPLNRPIDHLLHAFQISRSKRLEWELPTSSQKAEVVVIPSPTLDFTVPFTSMVFTERLMALGYERTVRAVAEMGPDVRSVASVEPESFA